MQFAIWLVGLMCHLSAFVRETLQYQLHPKQGSVFFLACEYDEVILLKCVSTLLTVIEHDSRRAVGLSPCICI